MIADDYNNAMETAKARRQSVSCGIGFCCLFLSIIFLYLPWKLHRREQLRARDLPLTIQRAEPIISAINHYKKEKGKFPATLNDLVPRYMQRIPDAGSVAEDGWHYDSETNIEQSFYLDDDAGGWALYIRVRDEYSLNVSGGEIFVYHPSGQYPQQDYGGQLIPTPKWGYYQ